MSFPLLLSLSFLVASDILLPLSLSFPPVAKLPDVPVIIFPVFPNKLEDLLAVNLVLEGEDWLLPGKSGSIPCFLRVFSKFSIPSVTSRLAFWIVFIVYFSIFLVILNSKSNCFFSLSFFIVWFFFQSSIPFLSHSSMNPAFLLILSIPAFLISCFLLILISFSYSSSLFAWASCLSRVSSNLCKEFLKFTFFWLSFNSCNWSLKWLWACLSYFSFPGFSLLAGLLSTIFGSKGTANFSSTILSWHSSCKAAPLSPLIILSMSLALNLILRLLNIGSSCIKLLTLLSLWFLSEKDLILSICL